MANTNVKKYRERLIAERDRLTGDRFRLTNHNGEPMNEHMGEMNDFDPNHPGDTGTQLFEREKDQALHTHLDGLLTQINDALGKLDSGTYGLCDHCDQAISDARLAALPYTTLCIECQARVENP